MTSVEEYTVLPEVQKFDLCVNLLNEFGAGSFNRHGYELTHRCTLGLGGHSDGNSKTASINYRNLQFNCFVCGYGGDISWWIAVNRHLETNQVEPWLKEKLGIGSSLPINDLLRIIDSICNPAIKRPTLPKYNDKILKRWTWAAFHPYLTEERMFPEANLQRFEVGFADKDEDFGYVHRLIFPVRWKGQIVGWQARTLDHPDDPDRKIKYKNSPGFPRDYVLYGCPSGRDTRMVVVESPASVLRHVHQMPMTATLGSNVTDDQLRHLAKNSRLILFPDPGEAGNKWVNKITHNLSRSIPIDVVDNPYTEADAGDLDDEEFGRLVSEAVPGSIWEPKRESSLIQYIPKESGLNDDT